MFRPPELDPAAPLHFVINAASGRNDAEAKLATIDAALGAAGRASVRHMAKPTELAGIVAKAAAEAAASRSAVIAVGGDGTINTVAQAAHAEGCAMGVLPQGTFNYFARTHGIPTDNAEAAQALLGWTPQPVQVGLVNERLFLVNASLGLYPDLLQDREAYKARFGRRRWVALLAGLATLLHEHRQLHLQIELGGVAREVRTPTLFVGNNRLQLEQVGVREAPTLDAGCMAALMLRPIGTGSLLWLLLRGAFGSLGEAEDLHSFGFQRMRVALHRGGRSRRVKVAYDGEVAWMASPLAFAVSPKPLFLLKPAANSTGDEAASPS